MAEKFEYTRSWTDPEAFPLLSFTKNWENANDYPTIETDEEQVRRDMQSLHDEVKDYLNNKLIPAVIAEDATEEARQAAEEARAVWETYDSTKDYVFSNKVVYGGGSYICKQDCKGIAPGNPDYWLLIAARGEQGPAGAGLVIQDVYETVDALRAAFPTGNDNAYLVSADHCCYVWSETAGDWVSCGGVTGPKGDTGKSAYQAALQAGYSGTEEDFDAAMNAMPSHMADETQHVGTGSKETPVDGDSVALVDSEDKNKVKRLLWSQLMAAVSQSITGAKIETGSYTGTGQYGEGNQTSPGTTFASKLLVVMGSSGFGICVGGQKMMTYSVEPRYGGTSTAKWESCTPVQIRTDLSWYSSSGEYPQLNVSGEEYVWVNIG